MFQFVKSYTKCYESRFEFRSSSHQNVKEIENRRAGVTVTVVTKLGSVDGIFSSFMQNSWYKSNGKDFISLRKIDLRGFVMECDVPPTKLSFLIKCLPLLQNLSLKILIFFSSKKNVSLMGYSPFINKGGILQN